MTALRVDSLVAGYGGRAIIDGVTLTVAPAEVVALIGHNGAGKSTLLKAIFSLLRPSSGRISLGDRDITGLRSRDLLLAGLAYVPQEHSVFPKLTVAENLRMGAYLIDDEALYRQRLERSLVLFPVLANRSGQLAGLMSGGEQRMLEIARTLLMDPQVIMLDEPSIGLAPKMVDTVFETVAALKRAGKSVLVVEQNVRKALAAADRAYALELGRIVLEDRAAALIGDDRVAKLYMGAAKRVI
jgi:branched-chain amino acid transport system ATP-binding protein